MKRILIFLALILMLIASAPAQQAKAPQQSKARKEVRHGNREYRAKHYDRAEVNYRRAAHDDSNSYRAHYNLGNTLYRQKKYEQAVKSYTRALQAPKMSAKDSSRIFHNRGNSNLKAGLQQPSRAEGMQQFQQAVNDYQEALKRDPRNDNTRYNLSYAQKMLQQAQQQQKNGGGQGGGNNQQNQQGNNGQNQQNQNGQDKQNGQNKQNGKNKQDQNKQNNKQDNGNQDQQQKSDPKQQKQQQQQQKKQEAERLLEAVKNNEKNTMRENARRVEVAKPRNIEKDW